MYFLNPYIYLSSCLVFFFNVWSNIDTWRLAGYIGPSLAVARMNMGFIPSLIH
jgi:hypothetical protein